MMDEINHILRLSWVLALNKFKLRIAGRYLGIFWYILEPLAFFLILLSLQVNVGAASVPRYPAYLLLGLIMTNFFISATTGAVGSIRENKSLVQSISIPQEVMPLSTTMQFCFSHIIEFMFFIVATLYYGLFSPHILWYFPVFVIYLIFVSGLSFFLSALGVFIEDLHNIWAVGCRLLWLGTPIFYVLDPGTLLYKVNQFNPLYHFISMARNMAVYDSQAKFLTIFGMATLSMIMLIVGATVFRITKRRFGEFL